MRAIEELEPLDRAMLVLQAMLDRRLCPNADAQRASIHRLAASALLARLAAHLARSMRRLNVARQTDVSAHTNTQRLTG
jgi:hypothetical protein